MKPALTVDRLLAGGFTKAGRWRVGQDGRLEIMDVPARSGVYAFAIDGVAQYVGVAANSLALRRRIYLRSRCQTNCIDFLDLMFESADTRHQPKSRL